MIGRDMGPLAMLIGSRGCLRLLQPCLSLAPARPNLGPIGKLCSMCMPDCSGYLHSMMTFASEVQVEVSCRQDACVQSMIFSAGWHAGSSSHVRLHLLLALSAAYQLTPSACKAVQYSEQVPDLLHCHGR